MVNTIRQASPADAAHMLAIYAPIVMHTPISFENEPPDLIDMQHRIERIGAHYPWLVFEHAGNVLGYAYASQHRERAAYRWSVDVSVYVHGRAQRSGIGRALYTSLFAALVVQGLYNAFAGVTLPNAASVGLHESLGFQPVGVYRQVGYKFGAWHDVGWWHLLLQALVPAPDPPRSLESIVGTAAWNAALQTGMPLIHNLPAAL